METHQDEALVELTTEPGHGKTVLAKFRILRYQIKPIDNIFVFLLQVHKLPLGFRGHLIANLPQCHAFTYYKGNQKIITCNGALSLIMKKSITYNGVIAWNKLRNNVKAANMSTSQFKAVLHRK